MLRKEELGSGSCMCSPRHDIKAEILRFQMATGSIGKIDRLLNRDTGVTIAMLQINRHYPVRQKVGWICLPILITSRLIRSQNPSHHNFKHD